MEWLDNKLRFTTIKNRFWGIDDIEGEMELKKTRKITEKKINNIKRLKTEIIEIEEIQTEATEYSSLELLDDLNEKRKL